MPRDDREARMATTCDKMSGPIEWPKKRDLFGIQVSPVTCDDACAAILAAAQSRQSRVVSAFSVHALIEAAGSAELAAKVNRFAIIVPDGQPVRWALNWLHGARLASNVRGANLMWRLCQSASATGIGIYLYGGTATTLSALTANLQRSFPSLRIAGAESPPFRRLSQSESDAMVERVNTSGAGLMFIGLGCPKQDHFASDYVNRLRVVQVCVGAAFDFHGGIKATAPLWMQRSGLEWLYRLGQEPRRLWKRYLVTNSVFVMKLLAQLARSRFASRRAGADGGDGSEYHLPHGQHAARRQSAVFEKGQIK